MSTLDRIRKARESQRLGRVASLGIGAYQGATFNFGDELAGAAAAVIPGGKGYEEARDQVRSAYASARPGYRLAGEIAGSIAVPAAGAGGFIARGAGAAAQAGRAAAVGAAQGGLAGVGAGDGGIGDRALSGVEGAAVGGALGGAASATLARLTRARARQQAPGAAEAQARGIRLTRGQHTGDIEQLSREHELLGIRGAGGDTLRSYLEGQGQDIAGELQRTAGRLGAEGDVAGNARDLVGGLRGAERQADRAVGDAYDAVRSSVGSITNEGAADAATDLARRLRTTIHDNATGIGLNPETGDFLESVANRMIERSGMAEAIAAGRAQRSLDAAVQSGATQDVISELTDTVTQANAALQRRAPSIQRIEGMRQGLNKLLRNQTDPQRRLGLQRMVGDFDDWLQGTVTRGLMQGDDELVGRLRNARGLARHYHSLFGTGGRTGNARAADRIIQGLVDEQAGPDEAIRFIQRINQTGGVGTTQALARIQEASPEAYDMLRSAHFQNMLVNPKTGNELTPNRIASNLDHLVRRQPDLARRLYGPEGVRDIRGLSSALRATDRQLGAAGNVSRSGFTAANLARRFGRLAGLATGIVGGNPQVAFTTLLTEGLSNVENLGQALKATRPVPSNLNPVPPVARAAVAGAGRVAPGLTDTSGPEERGGPTPKQVAAIAALAQEQQELIQRQMSALSSMGQASQTPAQPQQAAGQAWTRRSATPQRDEGGRIIGIEIVEQNEQGETRSRRVKVDRDAAGRFSKLVVQ